MVLQRCDLTIHQSNCNWPKSATARGTSTPLCKNSQKPLSSLPNGLCPGSKRLPSRQKKATQPPPLSYSRLPSISTEICRSSGSASAITSRQTLTMRVQFKRTGRRLRQARTFWHLNWHSPICSSIGNNSTTLRQYLPNCYNGCRGILKYCFRLAKFR